MTLPFSKLFDRQGSLIHGKPTQFKEKILALVDKTYQAQHKPKLHSIRLDKAGRWKAGRPIHMAYGNRTKYYECFNQEGGVLIRGVDRCFSTQRICIVDTNEEPNRINSDTKYVQTVRVRDVDFHATYRVKVDDTWLTVDEIKELAVNDGFENADDFFTYFCDDFTGVIVHWTPYRYGGE